MLGPDECIGAGLILIAGHANSGSVLAGIDFLNFLAESMSSRMRAGSDMGTKAFAANRPKSTPLQCNRDVRAPRSCCVLVGPRISCTLKMTCRGPWPGQGSLTSESVALPALRAWAGRAQVAAIRRGLNPLLAPICAARAKALAAKRVQCPDQSNSRLPESRHAMLRINIPQHSRGLVIASERAVSQ